MKFGNGVGGLRVYLSFTRIEDQTRINVQPKLYDPRSNRRHKWISEHPIYRANWTLQHYKCASGHYSPHVKA
jgi:hypothetical protein